jgi:hypothetical protein
MQGVAIAVTIAAPIALIVATWEPLEPPARPARPNIEERVNAAGTAVALPPGLTVDNSSRERKERKEAAPTYAIPTSSP